MGQKTTAEHLSWQNGLYIEALQDLEPRVLEAACKGIIRDGDRFPKPKEIRDAARELLERRDAARALSDTTPDADLGATMRSEAILLLGCAHYEIAAALKSPSDDYRNFLAEAANAWSRVRPEGGLAEVDAQKSGRRIYGFALEAWARAKLGWKPIHSAFASESVRKVFRMMAGREIDTHEDEPPTGPMADLMRQAVGQRRA